MSNYRRSFTKGGTYFFTVNAFRRQTILTHPNFRNALKIAVIEARQRFPFTINAWVLLPDHLHCIWTLPQDDADFSGRWAFIKRTTTKQCKAYFQKHNWLNASHIKRSESTLWQRRFWEHQIRDERDYQTHMDYIYWNPVKHGHVTAVKDWPYSTFHRDVERGIYSNNWGSVDLGKLSGRDFGE
jgi:putative transposase